jgi:hypothetical protein
LVHPYGKGYNGTDANHDGIGDTPYVINSNNVDRYPLMTPWGVNELPALGRYRHLRFSASNSPFFFFGNFSCLVAGLAGSETIDKKMPYVWRIHFRRALDRNSKAKTQMSKMRQHKKLERWKIRRTLRKSSALPMSRLRLPVFRKIAFNFSFSFFKLYFIGYFGGEHSENL